MLGLLQYTSEINTKKIKTKSLIKNVNAVRNTWAFHAS